MSSFLAATLATFAQPTFFESRPSEKNRSTTGLAKLWIATETDLTVSRYTCQRYHRSLRGGRVVHCQGPGGRLRPALRGSWHPRPPRRARRVASLVERDAPARIAATPACRARGIEAARATSRRRRRWAAARGNSGSLQWRRAESNRGPRDYETLALAN